MKVTKLNRVADDRMFTVVAIRIKNVYEPYIITINTRLRYTVSCLWSLFRKWLSGLSHYDSGLEIQCPQFKAVCYFSAQEVDVRHPWPHDLRPSVCPVETGYISGNNCPWNREGTTDVAVIYTNCFFCHILPLQCKRTCKTMYFTHI